MGVANTLASSRTLFVGDEMHVKGYLRTFFLFANSVASSRPAARMPVLSSLPIIFPTLSATIIENNLCSVSNETNVAIRNIFKYALHALEG